MSDVLNVHQGMAQVIAAVSHIAKGRSQGVSYEFRSIDAVMNHLHGPLADAGLYLAPRVLDDWQLNPIPGTNNRTQYQAIFRVAVDVWASDGTSVTLGPGLAQAHDYGDKAAYQAQQNAIKYLLLESFCIPTSEPDMDGRQPDPSTDDVQVRAARALASSPIPEGSWPMVCGLYHDGATSTTELPDEAASKLLANLGSEKAVAAILERVEAAA